MTDSAAVVKKVAVMTSGGDAQGMNSFVRAVVRTGLLFKSEIYAVYGGFQGLVDGTLKKMGWDDVSGFLATGGTTIGTSRCMSYQNSFDVRTEVVFHLVSRGIDRLICCGGDGSLTGTDVLMREWKDHLAALVKAKKITEEVALLHSHFYLVGSVGSIDNDMMGTEMTIGCDSALQRIIEALDAIMTTASSHHRSFVVEVMGRHCGYLALMSALATGADWAFIPEAPVGADSWREKLAVSINKRRELGSRRSVVIVAEGAIDSEGKKISAEDIKLAIEEGTKMDTRISVLGHIQRGGTPSAYDRYMSTLVGREAVIAILGMQAASPTSPAIRGILVGMEGDRICKRDLMEQVALTRLVGVAMKEHDYAKAFKMRGHRFGAAFKILKTLARAFPHELPKNVKPQCWGVMHVGAPAPGMNSAIRAAVRMGLDRGHTVYGIYNGFAGLVELDAARFGWYSVAGWSNLGGALLGANRDLPEKVEGGMSKVAESIKKLGIDGLIIVGGWEAHAAVYQLHKSLSTFPTLKLPIVVVPATISNNCPGTNHSIGSDTAVNTIVEATDRIKLSAMSSRRRVFVVETMGGHCGYLTLVAAIAGGAQIAYLPEHGVRLKDISEDIEKLKTRFKFCRSTSLILNNEKSSKTYTTRLIHDLMAAESDKIFSVRLLILGHIQQGNAPSPRDRELAASLAFHSVELLDSMIAQKKCWHGAVGERDGHYISTPFPELLEEMNFEKRRPAHQWWEELWEVVVGLRSTPKNEENYRPIQDSLFQETKPFVNLAELSSVQILRGASSVQVTPRSPYCSPLSPRPLSESPRVSVTPEALLSSSERPTTTINTKDEKTVEGEREHEEKDVKEVKK